MKTSCPDHAGSRKVAPPCPVFGECGGCQYQDISYEEELRLKERFLRDVLNEHLSLDQALWDPLVPSPKQFHYRSRMDIQILKTLKKEFFLGFSTGGRNRLVEALQCLIAMEPISRFLPELKAQATAKLPEKYRVASLVVKTGDDGRVLWGGIGRRSLHLDEKDYLWTVVRGRKIFYSLDTFFQANLSILPHLIDRIAALGLLDKETIFLDLYGGVGLFGVSFHDEVKRVVLVEENIHATRLARHNARHHGMKDLEVFEGAVEDFWRSPAAPNPNGPIVALIDPPRKGLSERAAASLIPREDIRHLLYLSCNPQALARDIGLFTRGGWAVRRVMPFDFFPRTRHIETLVYLTR